MSADLCNNVCYCVWESQFLCIFWADFRSGFQHCLSARAFTQESQIDPDPDAFEKFLLRYFCRTMLSFWQKVAYTPPSCIKIRLPFVSQYFCRSIRVRGPWNTPQRNAVFPWFPQNYGMCHVSIEGHAKTS